MSSKMTIIEGNSNDKDNVRAYMVKGEPGDDGVSPTITASRSGSTTTLNIVDAEGTKQAILNDGFSPTVETSKTDGVTTVEITDINGTRTTEIVDGIDLTGGVPTDGVIGFDGEAADIPDGYEVVGNIDEKLVSVGATAPTDGERVWFAKSKNVYDYTKSTLQANASITTSNDTVTITTTTETTSGNLFFRTKIDDSLLTNGKSYTISYTSVSGVNAPLRLQLRNHDGSNANKSQANTVVYDSNYSLFVVGNPFAVASATVIPVGTQCIFKDMQVEEGSTATTYEPYAREGLYVDEELLYQPPVVLWTNSSPTSEFASQTITLSDDISNYSYWEVIFSGANTNHGYSTGKIPVYFTTTNLTFPRPINGFRSVTVASSTTITIGNYQQYISYNGSASNDNTRAIPYQILGYK